MLENNMNFKNFHAIYTEELALDRVRQVRKSLQRKRKLKYGTFGFDIEFDYSEETSEEQIMDWMRFIDQDDKYGWLEKFEEYLQEQDDNPSYGSMDDWDENNPEPDQPSIARFEKPEPQNFKDNADYIEALEYWRNIESEWEEYFELYEQHVEEYNMMESQLMAWNKLRKYYLKNFAEDTIYDAYEHIDFENSSKKVDDYQAILDNFGEEYTHDASEADFTTEWVVALDADKPEIASRILTTKDMPLVREVLEELENEKTSPDCSAHIHIGMPKDFDLFSLFSLYSLVDEKSLLEKMPRRNFEQWSKPAQIYLDILNTNAKALLEERIKIYKLTTEDGKVMIRDQADVFKMHHEFRKIARGPDGETIEDDFTEIEPLMNKKFSVFNHYHDPTYNYDEYQIDWVIGEKPGLKVEPVIIKKINDSTIEFIGDDVLKYFLRYVTEKFSGVNVSYFKSRNTVEFRYLSSDILGNVDEFLSFINYFLLLPHIAQRAKKINLKSTTMLKGPDQRYRIVLKNT